MSFRQPRVAIANHEPAARGAAESRLPAPFDHRHNMEKALHLQEFSQPREERLAAAAAMGVAGVGKPTQSARIF